MSPFHVVKTKIRKIGGGNVNSCLELFISGRFALGRPLDIQVDFVEGKEREGFSVEQSLGFACHYFLGSDRWLVTCANLNRILLGRHISANEGSLLLVRLCSLFFWKLN